MCRVPAAIAQPPSQATHPSNQGRFTFTVEQFLYKRRNNCVNSGLRPWPPSRPRPCSPTAASTATLQPWPPPRPRPCSHGSSVSSFVISSACYSFYTNVLCRSSSCPRLLPGPPPAWPASCLARLRPRPPQAGEDEVIVDYHGLEEAWPASAWSTPQARALFGQFFCSTCNSFYTNVSSVSSFVQPATVFIQTFLRSVLLFNLQQFLCKRFIQVIKLLPGLPPPAWLASCLARLLPGPPPGPPPRPPPAWPAAWHASSRRGRGHRGLPWSGRSLARLASAWLV